MTSDYIYTFLAVHDNLKYFIFQVSKMSSLQIRTFKTPNTIEPEKYPLSSVIDGVADIDSFWYIAGENIVFLGGVNYEVFKTS